MKIKGLTGVVVAITLSVLAGCGKDTSEERLVEIGIRLEKQQQEIGRLTATLEGIEKRLGEMDKPREKVSVSSKPSQVPFKDTREYGEIASYISGIQQQLSLTQNRLAETQESVERHDKERFMDRAEEWRAVGEPQELNQRLDILAEKFSASVGDPTLTEEFAADVERLKSIFSAPRTPQQERELARMITSEAIQMMPHDEKSQQWLEGQLRALDQATNPLEVAARVNVTVELWKAWEVSQLARRHNVPPEMMEACGLTMSPQAWSYVPAEVTDGVGITPSR